MEIAVMTILLTKRDMKIYSGHTGNVFKKE